MFYNSAEHGRQNVYQCFSAAAALVLLTHTHTHTGALVDDENIRC